MAATHPWGESGLGQCTAPGPQVRCQMVLKAWPAHRGNQIMLSVHPGLDTLPPHGHPQGLPCPWPSEQPAAGVAAVGDVCWPQELSQGVGTRPHSLGSTPAAVLTPSPDGAPHHLLWF